IEHAIFVVMNKTPADRPQSAEQFAQLLGIQGSNTASMRVFTNTMQRRIPSGAQAILDRSRPWWRRTPAIAAAAIILFAVGAVALQTAFGRPKAAVAGPEARRLAVLYFTDMSRDSSLRPLADGVTESLTRSLSTASSYSVVSTTGAARFRGSALAPDSIARALRVGYLVRGEVEPEGNSVRIAVRLDEASGVNLQRVSLVIPAGSVLQARDTITTVVADLVRRQLGQQFQVQQQRASTSNADAWLLLQRGEAARSAMDVVAAQGDTIGRERWYHAADSLYAQAWALDPRWAEPQARRAQIAYRQSRLTRDPTAMRRWVAIGLAHTDSALAIDAANPDALELRGTLKYWSFLQNFEEDATRKAALIDEAKANLEKATEVNVRQAGAYSTLSHLYNNHPSTSSTDVLIAAQRAYEADEFLSDAELVLARIFLAAYDLGQFDKADQWCGVARMRFPASWRSFRCQLFLLTMRNKNPDIATAWRLADTVTALAPNARYYRLNSDMLVGAVIARASRSNPALADSARRVIRRSEGDAGLDPVRDLALYGAIGYVALGDYADAVRLLKIHLAVNPQKTASFRDDPGWQYRELAPYPPFRQLVGVR
ncbi:MAG TPA: hypothetical protein VNB23_00740, partial [Ramlibacter sp.]|nr:hypothetical protein [Ramlibacter sp.]